MIVVDAASGERLNVPAAAWRLDMPLRKVQYGSDFLLIVSTGAAAVDVLLSLAKVLDTIAAAGIKNEERLAKKAERMRARQERVSNDQQVGQARLAAAAIVTRDSATDDEKDAAYYKVARG